MNNNNKQVSWTEICNEALNDPEFRQFLIDNPRQAIENKFNIALPKDVNYIVHEQSAETVHLVLPPVELSADPQRIGDDDEEIDPQRIGDDDEESDPQRIGDDDEEIDPQRIGDDDEEIDPQRIGDDGEEIDPQRIGDDDEEIDPQRIGDDDEEEIVDSNSNVTD